MAWGEILGTVALAIALWGVLGELRIWSQLRFRSPRYLVLSLGGALALGLLMSVSVSYAAETPRGEDR